MNIYDTCPKMILQSYAIVTIHLNGFHTNIKYNNINLIYLFLLHTMSYPTTAEINEYEPTPIRQYDLLNSDIDWQTRINIALVMFWKRMDHVFCDILGEPIQNLDQFSSWICMLESKGILDSNMSLDSNMPLKSYRKLVRSDEHVFGKVSEANYSRFDTSQYFWLDNPKTVNTGPTGLGGMTAHLIPHYHKILDILHDPTYMGDLLTMNMLMSEEGKAKYGVDHLGSIQICNLGIKTGKLYSLSTRFNGQRVLFTPYKQKQDAMRSLDAELLLTEHILGFSSDDAKARISVICLKNALESYNGKIRVIRKRIYYVISIEPPQCIPLSSQNLLDSHMDLKCEFMYTSAIKFIYGIVGHSNIDSYGVWFDGESLRIWCHINGPTFTDMRGRPWIDDDLITSDEFKIYKKQLILLNDHHSITGTAYGRYRQIMTYLE